MRLFGLVDNAIDRLDRPTFFGSPFTLAWATAVVVTELAGANLPPVYNKPQRLALLVRESPTGPLLGDFTEARGVTFGTNEHGFAEIVGTMPMGVYSAFAYYHQRDPLHIELTDGREPIYEGRIEDVGISKSGLAFTGLGYWRSASDLLVSAIYSDADLTNWVILNDADLANVKPDKYQIDKYNRLALMPLQDTTYSSATNLGAIGYAVPDNSITQIVRVKFSYRFKMASPWKIELHRCSSDWASLGVVWSLTGNGSEQTATDHEVTITASDAIRFTLFYNGTATTYTGETGDQFAILAGLQVKGLDYDNIDAGHIARHLVAHISGRNPTQLITDTSAIEAPGVAIDNARYEDIHPAEILNKLAAIGDDQTPPRRYAARVWEGRRLQFGPATNNSRSWYVDVLEMAIERTLDSVKNTVYATYSAGSERGTRRTAEAAENVGQVIRMAHIPAATSSASVAETYRDTHLTDNSKAKPRATIRTLGLYDAMGVMHPLYAAKAGDTITIRNLPPDLDDLDHLRTFTIGQTRYHAYLDLLEPIPETPAPDLAILVARREEY